MEALSSSMAKLGFALFLVAGIGVACGGSAPAVTSPTTPGGTPATPTPSGEWKELRVSWDFGPCPDDGRSCHQTLAVDHEGGFTATETSTSGEPVKRFAALDAQEVRELHRIVDGSFVAKLGSFGCPPETDATIRISLDGREEEVGGCVHAPDGAASPPRALVELLERHRFAKADAPPAHPQLPTGVGDPCSTTVGCAQGLVCMPFPCLVAPCITGSCQKQS